VLPSNTSSGKYDSGAAGFRFCSGTTAKHKLNGGGKKQRPWGDFPSPFRGVRNTWGVVPVQPEHAVPKGKALETLCARELEDAIKVEAALPGWWQGLLGKHQNVFNRTVKTNTA